MRRIRILYILLPFLTLIAGMGIYLIFRDVNNMVLFSWIPKPDFIGTVFIPLKPSIYSNAFRNKALESVSIPPSVTRIASGAFRNNNLNPYNVEIPSRLLHGYGGDSIFDSDVYKTLIAIENPETIAKANEMYELANKRRDEGNISAAIYFYNGVRASMPKFLPAYTDSVNNLKTLWDKRIAENQRLYPAPFEGEWKFIIKPSELVAETKTVKGSGTGAIYTAKTGKLIVKPEENIIITFRGIKYTQKSTNGKSWAGTFYYHNGYDLGDGFSLDVLKGFTSIDLLGESFSITSVHFDGKKIYWEVSGSEHMIFERIERIK
jgi:hypothetical protein